MDAWCTPQWGFAETSAAAHDAPAQARVRRCARRWLAAELRRRGMARKSGPSALTMRSASGRGEVLVALLRAHSSLVADAEQIAAGQLGEAGLVERWWGGVGARGTRWRAILV